uniref:Uncharacterized protein LOC104243347 n=1 Tax=Nicotiana sylvestris TaxID=4096 RepID=A0A1U7Y119_NICSY|nr:PREDICTED: uncharacterized protein LOC104243347 [Nicotiana sylvestris]
MVVPPIEYALPEVASPGARRAGPTGVPLIGSGLNCSVKGLGFGKLWKRLQKKTEALEYLKGEADRVMNACSELRAQVRAHITDAQAEALLSRTRADQEMEIHVKDAADAQVELKRALDREKRIKEYVHCRSRREVPEEVDTRGFILSEELARAKADESDAWLLLADVSESKYGAGGLVSVFDGNLLGPELIRQAQRLLSATFVVVGVGASVLWLAV